METIVCSTLKKGQKMTLEAGTMTMLAARPQVRFKGAGEATIAIFDLVEEIDRDGIDGPLSMTFPDETFVDMIYFVMAIIFGRDYKRFMTELLDVMIVSPGAEPLPLLHGWFDTLCATHPDKIKPYG